ncbi:MAG: hypothetical protein KBT06_04460 [Prevotellaceae bacterium]|nr:hypothetical protein [Candidatus Colivivens equi]
MTRQEFIEKIVPSIKNGAYRHIEIRKSLASELKAAYRNDYSPDDIIKESVVVARLGVKYSHMSVVAAKVVERGLKDAEVEFQLPWGEWDAECPYLINHKGQTYVRLAVSASPNVHSRVSYKYKGKEISKEELQALGIIRDGYWNKAKPDTVFTVSLQSIVAM